MSEAKEKLKKIVLEEIEKLDEYQAEMLTMLLFEEWMEHSS